MTTRTRKGAPADILMDWLTIEQAAVVAGVSEATIVAWIKQGKVEAFHIVTETPTVH